jgi:hypothetical protein
LLKFLTSRIISSLLVGDYNDDPETQRNEHFYSYVDAASGADVLKVFEQRYYFGRRIQELVNRSHTLQGVGVGGHSF